MRNYREERVVIIGLGKTGLSCIDFFLNRGVIPKIMDTCKFSSAVYKLPCIIQYWLGELNDTWLLNATLIVVSPGVKLDHPVLIEAVKVGIEVVSDIELFIREVTMPIVAITGSNGKSTVTRLIASMAKCARWNVGVGGNIGIPVLNLLKYSYQLYILEISSFQLDTTYSLNATVATILNISEDHMDRYSGDLKKYYLSKQKIYHNALVCVTNVLDILTIPLFNSDVICVSVGLNVDSADYHLKYYKGTTWIMAYNEYVLNCSEMKVSSNINYVNALFALALSDVVKIPRFASLMALRQFSGLPHRCQLIYKNRGVSWINDSKATNVGATKEAINSLTISNKLHLLLGGDSKLADFSELKFLIKQYGIYLYCFGKDGENLAELGCSNVVLTDTLEESMYIVSKCVQRRDIVLLSPACSSLDQFLSFESRGFIFTYLAQNLG